MTSQSGTRARPEFPYLDGLRGAAAMIVVAYHAFLFTGLDGDAEKAMPFWDAIVGFGYVGVAVFIVLSGYVLMLPVVSTPELTLRGGSWGFVKRRARRIIPPYYAALIFSLLLIWLFPVLQQPAGTAWDSKIPLTWGGVISHFFLLQDFSSSWILQINGPLWSVAVEWHIYFLMILLLLPLWRRIPPVAIVGTLVVVTLIPVFLQTGTFLHPWFVALFAAGMWAAQLTMAPEQPRHLRTIIVVLLAATAAAFAVKLMGVPSLAPAEMTAGLAVAAGLVWAGRRVMAGATPRIVKPFATRPMMFLGLISYSIYLFHSPLLALMNLLTLPLALPTVVQYLLLTFVGIPIAVAVSWGMFWLVERHFLNTRQKHVLPDVERRPAGTAGDGASPVAG